MRQYHSVVSAFEVWGMPGAAGAVAAAGAVVVVAAGHARSESGREAGCPALGTACQGALLSFSSSSHHTCPHPLARAVAGEVVAVGPPRPAGPPRQSSVLGMGCCPGHHHSQGKQASPAGPAVRAGPCCLCGTSRWPLQPLCQRVCWCHPHSLGTAAGYNSLLQAAAAGHSSAQPDSAACNSPGAMFPVRSAGSSVVCHGNHTFL